MIPIKRTFCNFSSWLPARTLQRCPPIRNSRIPQTLVRNSLPKLQLQYTLPMPHLKITQLKLKQQEHLAKLQALALNGEWQHLQEHTLHPDSGFDWWMFPSDRKSRGYGAQYQMSHSEIKLLRTDPIFMRNYREGILLVAQSWGWDLETLQESANPAQKWTNYQVRLGKMLDSLRLFKQDDLRRALTYFIDKQQLAPSLEPWIQQLLFRQ
jgi:hypothetical protein